MMGSVSVFHAVLTAMKAVPNSGAVQHHGCGFLLGIGRRSRATCWALVRHGAVRSAMSAMANCPDDALVAEYGPGLLSVVWGSGPVLCGRNGGSAEGRTVFDFSFSVEVFWGQQLHSGGYGAEREGAAFADAEKKRKDDEVESKGL